MDKQKLMKKFIVTTTINPPTDALLKYSKLEGWTVIVAGDLKTNHDLLNNGQTKTYEKIYSNNNN